MVILFKWGGSFGFVVLLGLELWVLLVELLHALVVDLLLLLVFRLKGLFLSWGEVLPQHA